MTSLSPHYNDDHEALGEHLQEEHAIFLSETPEASRAHLCCADYGSGPEVKRALEQALGGKGFVRTALNNRAVGGYCAIAHAPSALAADARTLVHPDVECSPLTHASKEPESLLGPDIDTTSGDGGGGGRGSHGSRGGSRGGSGGDVGGRGSGRSAAAHFGLRLGASVQDGPTRGLVVTLSPGSLAGGGAAEGGERKLAAGVEGGAAAAAARPLEARWRSFWDGARGRAGARELAEVVPWTSGSSETLGVTDGVTDGATDGATDGGGGKRRSLAAGEGGSWRRTASRARKFHGGKTAGYLSALEHLGERMEEEGGRALSEACGWDSNLSFVHAGDELVYLR